jgi:uncharacterized membrane protein YqiK
MGLIGYLLFCACLLTFALLRFFNLAGLPSRSVLLPYESGVLFQRGKPIREVGPGRHWVILGLQKILFLDTRPIQIDVDERAVSLADGSMAFYGIAASARVCDARKAIYASTNYNDVPLFVALCDARSILGRCTRSELAKGRARVEQEMIEACQLRLASVGFELVSFRISELSVATQSDIDD